MRKTLKGGLVLAAMAGTVTIGGTGSAMADANTAPTTDTAGTARGGWAVINSDAGTVTPMASKEVGGGTWNYGSSIYSGWSDYYHRSACHGSSARSGRYFVRDHGVRPGSWSRATVTKDGTVYAYWTNTC